MASQRLAQRICLAWHTGAAKLFNVHFAPDHLFLSFPYQPDAPGIASVVKVKPGKVHYRLAEEFTRTTLHKVKYSHPVDGRAHISQDSKIIKQIENQAASLHGEAGHIFTVQLQGFSEFKPLDLPDYQSHYDDATPKYHLFELDAPEPPASVRFVGRWKQLKRGVDRSVLGERAFTRIGGHPYIVILPPVNFSVSGSALFLGLILQEAFSRQPGAVVHLSGGFGAHMENPSKDSSFVSLRYPFDETEDPDQVFLSMDYRPTEQDD